MVYIGITVRRMYMLMYYHLCYKGKGRRRSRRNTSSNNSSSVSHNASGSVTSADMSLATRRTSSRLRLRTKVCASNQLLKRVWIIIKNVLIAESKIGPCIKYGSYL